MRSIFAPPFMLNEEDPKRVDAYLKSVAFYADGEKLERVSLAGDGNMNVVLRAETNTRSFIIKQSRPWVNKYPDVDAPADRIFQENLFYEIVRQNEELREYTPEVYLFDPANYILCMQDFGDASDFTDIYRKGHQLTKSEMADVSKTISALHFNLKDILEENRIENKALRTLNHQHIFVLPLDESNGFDLNLVMPGLHDKTANFRKDPDLKKMAKELGELYLNGKGSKLLHGDYYPGSWLRTAGGVKMIDPEFCFTGTAEFELGVTMAHLKMAQQPDSLMKDLFVYYHFDEKFDGSLFSKFAGMEIIRRIIGLAQLPLELSLAERLSLLDEAYELVITG
ncbi:MAG: phosphotransferase [Flavobacteriales bacterium]|nr:phosphotransferase [Flavobacteriales bacterium]